jgi:hypothetical protein
MKTNFKTWLSLLSIALFMLLLWHHQPAPCQKTLHYRVGHFDQQFGLRRAEFLSLIKQAENIWEASVGTNLFTYDPAADFTINLIFDGRQRTTVAGRTLVHNLRTIESSHTNLATSFEHWQKIFKEKSAAYQQALADYQVRLNRYNDKLRDWNNKKGTVESFHKLIQARQRLLMEKAGMDEKRLSIIDLLETLQSIQAQGETIANAYQTQRQMYQAHFVKPNSFNQGEYDGKSITLYQFNDPTDLLLLLAHELGHALGLQHVDDPRAVMYYLKVRHDKTQPVLTRNDIDALKTACHLD